MTFYGWTVYNPLKKIKLDYFTKLYITDTSLSNCYKFKVSYRCIYLL